MAAREIIKKSFWDFKTYTESEWFKRLALTLIILGLLYTLLHLFINEWCNLKVGYEYSRLDKGQMEQINRIYFDTFYLSRSPAVVLKKDSTVVKAKDSVKYNDSAKKPSTSQGDNIKIKDSLRYHEYRACDKVLIYLNNQFNNKINPTQADSLRKYLCMCSPLEATGFLSNVRLQVKSFFWLTGPAVYFEIIFWAWFGVICSLLFNLGIITKNRTTNPMDPSTYFDSSEIPFQVAKLLYAPACTLIIVLGYNFFSDENIVDISSSKGVIVFSFICGFYSSRLISFLDRLKALVLPVSSDEGIVSDPTPLRNIVVQIRLDENAKEFWDVLKTDLHTLEITLQKEESTQQAIALNIDKNQWPIYIFDYVKPGKEFRNCQSK